MNNNKTQYLTLGTFFNLLLQSLKPKQSIKVDMDGRSDKISEPKVLQAILNIINPHITYPGDSTGRSECTNFKKGVIYHSSWIDVSNTNTINQFKYDFSNCYSLLLERLDTLINNYLDVNNTLKIKRLVCSMFELIQIDPTIYDLDVFYLHGNQNPIYKKDIFSVNYVSLQQLLIGILHFILNRKMNRFQTQETFSCWFKQSGKRYSFISNIGEKYLNSKIEIFISPNTKQEKTIEINESEPLFLKYKQYYEKELEEIVNLKTILYKNAPISFNKIYIPSSISYKESFEFEDDTLYLN